MSVTEYNAEFMQLAARNQLSESENQQAARFLSGLKLAHRDKIGVQMVFSVQEARNLAMRVELLIQEQTQTANYRRYGRGDNKAAFDKGKMPQTSNVDSTTIGIEKDKGVMGEKSDTTASTKNGNPYTKHFGIKCYRCGEI